MAQALPLLLPKAQAHKEPVRREDGPQAQTQFNTNLTFTGTYATKEGEGIRNRLREVGSRFIGFDKTLVEGNSDKKDVEQQRIRNLISSKEGICELEKGLNVECKRRLESNKQLQQLAEHRANSMLDSLQSSITDRLQRITSSIDSLTFRTMALEKGIKQFQGEVPTKLQTDTAALVKCISELREEMMIDKQERIKRDEQFLKRTALLQQSIDEKLEKEKGDLKRDCNDCYMAVQSFARSASYLDEEKSEVQKFHEFLMQEVSAMKNTLSVASHERERNDDDAVEALNTYVNALQKGLFAANKRSQQ